MRCFTLSPEQFPVWDTYYRLADYDYDDTLPIVRQQSRDASTIWSFNKIHHQNIDNGPSFTHWLSRLSSTTEGQTEMNKSKKSTMLLTGALGLGEWGIPEPGTVYKGENLANARGSVMQVKASKCRPCTYYSITDGGQLSSHTVRFDISSHLRSRHRFDPEDKTDLSAEIEDDIYCRRISKAQEKLHLLKIAPIHDEQEARQRREEVDFLEECLILRDPITDWAPNSMPDKSKKRISRRFWSEDDLWESAINTFKFDLKYWSYRIPPGCNTAFAIPVSGYRIEPIRSKEPDMFLTVIEFAFIFATKLFPSVRFKRTYYCTAFS
ncbi:hypothetical protein BDF20DRAFT_433284 [Mycotypha africana]|uniref:uncharacterized protein n=1 Tax=Mycotypha africana TaxID=64632 RepID=UPI0023019C45|nr:uncharacterized protein BDF20DRAFT_433284 [Mycotypha africana]KAI8981856.1 hypothetical protein BDF20DRAFT_433284 [Mycotypha africana]